MDFWNLIGKGHVDEIREILSESPGVVEERTKWGGSPLELAVECDQLDMVKLLLEKGADVDAKLEHRSPVSGRTSNGLTAIMESRSLEVIDVLVNAGADVNHKDHDGQSVVFHVGRKYRPELIDELRKNGAALDSQEIEKLLSMASDELDGRKEAAKAESSERILKLESMVSWCKERIAEAE